MIASKKGVELTFNLIITAAILLIVLVVVIFIFIGRTTIFTGGLQDCTSKQGTCELQVDCKGPTISGTNCEKFDPPRICCLKV